MPKIVINELDVKLSKRDVVKLCKKTNIIYNICTNINGGKYIECIVGYDHELNQSKYIDIYYNCFSNRKLYGLILTESNKQFYVDLIMEYFLRKNNINKKEE